MPQQPSNDWSFQVLKADGNGDGDAKTLAVLGIDDAQYELNNIAADTLTLTAGGRAIDAATLWPYGTLLALLKPDGTRFFVGRVEPWTREGNGDAQNHFGRLVNPWWYLTQKIYEQRYRFFNGLDGTGAAQFANMSTPRVVLNILSNGDVGGLGFYPATTGQQIADAVNWAISLGAPIKLGVVDPSTLPFSDSQKGIFCADVIKLMFRKEPDFIVDWDYSTLPFPTIHFRKVASLTPLNIDMRVTSILDAVSIKERPDWQRSYVKITYDQQDTTSGGAYLYTQSDWYSAAGVGGSVRGVDFGAPLPVDTESRFRGVDLFCDLQGFSTNSTNASTNFASVSFDINSLETWANWKPSLFADTVAACVILNGAGYAAPYISTLDEPDANGQVIPYDPTCVYEIVDGQYAAWQTGVKCQRVRVAAWFQVTNKNGHAHAELATHDMTAVSYNTNGQSKTFDNPQTQTTQYAEAVPVGLAQAMWQSWRNLSIEGKINNVESVIGFNQTITRSQCLNFLTASPGVNGQPDWRNVNALVQSISGNIATGTTSVQFGAPLKITGHELIDAVRCTRYRVTTLNLAYLFGGFIGGGTTQIQQGRKTHARQSDHGGIHKTMDVTSAAISPRPGIDPKITNDGSTGVTSWYPPNGNIAPTIVMDPAGAMGSDGKFHPVALREVKVPFPYKGKCYQRSVIEFCSLVFQGAGDPNFDP